MIENRNEAKKLALHFNLLIYHSFCQNELPNKLFSLTKAAIIEEDVLFVFIKNQKKIYFQYKI